MVPAPMFAQSTPPVCRKVRATMLLLGIETSCDDTATAVVRDGRDVLANVATNQDEFHAKYGGIVPEIASRRHVALLAAAVDDALGRAGLTLDEMDGIAVTKGPGLIGSLAVGVAAAKALAFAAGKRLFGVNHLHGHLFAPFLERPEPLPYPFLALLVSGGHTQLVAVEGPLAMRVLGRTRDDAAGEAFDKTARLLGLGYPGGPAIERLARDGNPRAVDFPRFRGERDSLEFSFSGLKTSVRYFLESPAGAAAGPADVAASFQAAVVDVLIERTRRALATRPFRALVLSGGVAANTLLRARFEALARAGGVAAFVPPLRYCTDNAAMIAAAAERQGSAIEADPLSLSVDPNLPFEAAYTHF
jgi:N6-L-threonylcarbamoyladenine synthase